MAKGIPDPVEMFLLFVYFTLVLCSWYYSDDHSGPRTGEVQTHVHLRFEKSIGGRK